MANTCFWHYFGETCEAPPVTTLTTYDGKVKQVCEKHYTILVENFRKIANGDESEWDDQTNHESGWRANHWFKLNKIPV